jgi:hypothetical protein
LLLCVAPDLKQASIVHGYIAGIISESAVLRPLLESSTRTTLRLANGIDVETRSASFRRLRGVTCIAAIADEAASGSATRPRPIATTRFCRPSDQR